MAKNKKNIPYVPDHIKIIYIANFSEEQIELTLFPAPGTFDINDQEKIKKQIGAKKIIEIDIVFEGYFL